MLQMQTWQWLLVAAVALVTLGRMTFALVGLFTRRAETRAAWRTATPLESALVAGLPTAEERAFDSWSYRVGGRFAGKVRVVVSPDTLVVSGPRIPRGIYRVWMWAQGLVLAIVPPALAWALVALDWRLLVLGVGSFVLSWAIATGGAGMWPGLGEMEYVTNGRYKAIEVPRSRVRDVSIGHGWQRGGLEVVLWPYTKGIDKLAEGRAVSFFAPDEHGLEVRYALHMLSDDDASDLAGLLGT